MEFFKALFFYQNAEPQENKRNGTSPSLFRLSNKEKKKRYENSSRII